MITIQFHSLKDTDFIFTRSFYVCDAMQLYLRTYHYFLGGEGGGGGGMCWATFADARYCYPE